MLIGGLETRATQTENMETFQDTLPQTQNVSNSGYSRNNEQVEPESPSKVDRTALRYAISLTMPEPEGETFAAGREFSRLDDEPRDCNGMTKAQRHIARQIKTRRKQARKYVPVSSDGEDAEDMPFGPPRPQSSIAIKVPAPSFSIGIPATPPPMMTNEQYAALHPVSPLPPPPVEALHHAPRPEQGAMQETEHNSTASMATVQGPTIPKHQVMECAIGELKLGFPMRVVIKVDSKLTENGVMDTTLSVDQVKDFDLLKRIIASQFGAHIRQHMDLDLAMDISLANIRIRFTDRDGRRKDVIKSIHGPATYNTILKRLLCMHSSFVNLCCCGACKVSKDIPEIIVSIRYLTDRTIPRSKQKIIHARQNPRKDDFIIAYNELAGPDTEDVKDSAALNRHGNPDEPQLLINTNALQNMMLKIKSLPGLQKKLAAANKKLAKFEKDERRDRKKETLKRALAKAKKQIRNPEAQLAAKSTGDNTHNTSRQGSPERPSISPLTSDNEDTIVIKKEDSSDESVRDGKRRKVQKRVGRAPKRAKSEEQGEEQCLAPVVPDPDPELVRQLAGLNARRACRRD